VHALRGVSLEIETEAFTPWSVRRGAAKVRCCTFWFARHPDAGRVLIESETVSHLTDDELAQNTQQIYRLYLSIPFFDGGLHCPGKCMIPMRKLGQLTDAQMRERAADCFRGRSGRQISTAQPSSFRRRTTARGHRACTGQ